MVVQSTRTLAVAVIADRTA